MARRILPLMMLSAVLASCGDPMAQEAGTYYTAVEPLMRKNSLLAAQFLNMTAAIYKDKVGIEKIADQVTKQVVPMAEELKTGMQAVKPQAEALADVHQQAVAAWTTQAEAYQEMMKAFDDKNLEGFNNACKKVGQAKVMVENYVRNANAVIEPYGYHLEEFPDIQ